MPTDPASVMRDTDFENLWTTATEPGPAFRHGDVAHLPDVAQRYFRHAIAEGTPRATAVRLKMHGTIRLAESWDPFEAEQVIRTHRGFVWRATIRMKGIPVKGSDRWVDGEGRTRWKLLGVVPLADESGPAVARSSAGRAQIEGIWLPPALLAESLSWDAVDADHAAARVQLGDEISRVELGVDATGRLTEATMLRWGTPDGVGTAPRRERFGACIDEELTFGGFTIPSRVRVGWYFGTDRFEEGEFFRGVIDDAVFR